MGKNQSASGLTNIIQYDNNGNVSFVSGSTTLMQISSSGAITTTGVISGSNALSASYALNSGLLNGTGSVGFATTGSLLTVSSSQQQISASQQQLSSSFLILTASFNAVSSSQQEISASLLNVISIFATTGSNSFRATQSITGSLTVTGQIIAQTLNVQQVTSSIIYSSGSNNFGCDLNSRQTFTGSVLITGSLTIAGASSAASYSGTTIYGSTAVCSAVGKFTSCIDITSAAATGTALRINGDNLTTGTALSIVSNDGSASHTGNLVEICNAFNAGATAKLMCLYQGDDGDGIYINMARGGVGLTVDGAGTGYSAIFNNGNIGIGTSAPLSLLHIASADTDQGLRLTRANGTYGVRITRTGQIQAKLVDDVTFQTAISLTEGNTSGSQYLALQPTAGNVSIGATGGGNPGAKLEVQDGANVAFSGTGYRLAIFSSTCTANADRPGIILGYDSAGGGIIAPATQAGTTNFLSFWTYNSGWGEKLRIAKDGQSTFSNTITANGGNILSCGSSYGIVQVKGSGASTWQMFANPSDEMRFGRSGVGDYLTLTNTGAASFACSVNFNGNGSVTSKVGGVYNATTTVTIGPSSWNGVMQIMVGVYGNGSGNTGRAMWIGGGYVGSGMPFTEVTRYCAGAVTIGALNANAGCYTFTVGYAFPNSADISVTVIGTNSNTSPATITFG